MAGSVTMATSCTTLRGAISRMQVQVRRAYPPCDHRKAVAALSEAERAGATAGVA
jgi:hypothetical protein